MSEKVSNKMEQCGSESVESIDFSEKMRDLMGKIKKHRKFIV